LLPFGPKTLDCIGFISFPSVNTEMGYELLCMRVCCDANKNIVEASSL